jgi:hypothetical protein
LRFYTLLIRQDFNGGGESVIDVYSQPGGVWLIGRAYFCGPNEFGDLLWSLRIGVEWTGGLWIIVDHQFVPAR